MTAISEERAVGPRFVWRRRDAYPWLTILSIVGVILSILLALAGLPALDLHGPLHRMGIMDPFCGGTRSAWLTTHGRLADAWRYNPLGIASVVGAVLVMARTAMGIIGRRWLTLRWAPSARARWAMVLVAVALLTLLEIRQQGRADLLTSVGTP